MQLDLRELDNNQIAQVITIIANTYIAHLNKLLSKSDEDSEKGSKDKVPLITVDAAEKTLVANNGYISEDYIPGTPYKLPLTLMNNSIDLTRFEEKHPNLIESLIKQFARLHFLANRINFAASAERSDASSKEFKQKANEATDQEDIDYYTERAEALQNLANKEFEHAAKYRECFEHALGVVLEIE